MDFSTHSVMQKTACSVQIHDFFTAKLLRISFCAASKYEDIKMQIITLV